MKEATLRGFEFYWLRLFRKVVVCRNFICIENSICHRLWLFRESIVSGSFTGAWNLFPFLRSDCGRFWRWSLKNISTFIFLNYYKKWSLSEVSQTEQLPFNIMVVYRICCKKFCYSIKPLLFFQFMSLFKEMVTFGNLMFNWLWPFREGGHI